MPANLQTNLDLHHATMAQVEAYLCSILHELAAQPTLMAYTDGTVPGQVVTKDFPFEGAKRAIVKRSATALNVPFPAAATGLLLPDNANRLGGSVVNKSASGVTIYLGQNANPGTGSLWLAPNGGSWDFRVSNTVWCGNVFAVADAGNLILAGLEL